VETENVRQVREATLPLARGVRQSAQVSGVRERFLWKAIAEKRLVPLRVSGRVLIADKELRKFLGIE
jgi:hypothetical protein